MSTEFPQLFNTVTVGAEGTNFGAADPLPALLTQPFTVCVTVYVLVIVTVMEVVEAPVLHNKEPEKLPAVRTEFPQLLVTDTVGAEGTAIGAAVPLPAGLTHPFMVCVTV